MQFLLWAIITKIQSESKSQRKIQVLIFKNSCEQSLRRYNLKANHNSNSNLRGIETVVSNHYEDTIWKQITTEFPSWSVCTKLWAIITKIQSESKSQRCYCHTAICDSCEQSLRRYNLKANHNYRGSVLAKLGVVSNHYEDTIWKQITTLIANGSYEFGCEQSLRRYNLKANHNQLHTRLFLFLVVSNHYEDTIWKQITTHESNNSGFFSCEQSLRRYNLKANHNAYADLAAYLHVVSNHYEDTIWKQITTVYRPALNSKRLWAIITKIQSESKSQP